VCEGWACVCVCAPPLVEERVSVCGANKPPSPPYHHTHFRCPPALYALPHCPPALPTRTAHPHCPPALPPPALPPPALPTRTAYPPPPQDAFFFAERGPGLDPPFLPVAAVLEWHMALGTCPTNASLGPAKRFARVGLMVSKGHPALCAAPPDTVPPRSAVAAALSPCQCPVACAVRECGDVVSASTGAVMTDGNACLGVGAMAAVTAALASAAPAFCADNSAAVRVRPGYAPAAVQGRLGGCKGVWLVNPFCGAGDVCVRPSMRKVCVAAGTRTRAQCQLEVSCAYA
jgi:hypothetical protein